MAQKKTLDDAIKEIAGIEIRDTYPNYSMIPTFVQKRQKVSFSWKLRCFCIRNVQKFFSK
jgi:hypothetical protein